MAYFKRTQKKVNGKWYPQVVIIGKPVQTNEVANRLADLSALSPGDCFSMLKNLGKVLGDFMNSGRTVKLEGVDGGGGQRQADKGHARPLHSRNDPWQQQSGNDPVARQRKHVLGRAETGFVRFVFGRG